MKYNKIALGFLGLVSGTLSIYLLLKWDKVFNGLEGFFTPGLIFGVILACYFGIVRARNFTYLYRLPIFIAMSWFAYYVAVWIVINLGLDKNNISSSPSIPSMFFAGCVGALILGFGFWAIKEWSEARVKYFVVLIILGGILGLTFFLGEPISQLVSIVGLKIEGGPSLMVLYIIWQTGIAFYLGYILDKAKEV